MEYRGVPLELADSVSFAAVQQYARATGWHRVQGIRNEQIAAYRRPDSDSLEIAVPLDRAFSDYSLRMAEVIAAMATHEGRPARQVLADLLLPPADIVRFGIEGPGTESGTIQVDNGLSFLAGARKALLAAACAVVRPEQPFFPRLSLAPAERFLQACRLTTEHGSFVAALICPLDALPAGEAEAHSGLFAAERGAPFTRKVTRTLLRGVDRLVDGIRNDLVDRVIEESADAAVSANLCEALLAMQPSDDRSVLTVSSTWARTEPELTQTPGRVQIPAQYFPTIERLSEALRPHPAPERQLFVGTVDTLSGDVGPDGRRQGEVVLTCLWEGDLIKARLDLSAPDYANAIRAHEESRLVELHGTLQRGRRVHRIVDYRDFSVIK